VADGSTITAVELTVVTVVLGYTVIGVRNVLRTDLWKKRSRKGFCERRDQANSIFFLLVPALREQNIIVTP
jgi:hypothetical protein